MDKNKNAFWKLNKSVMVFEIDRTECIHFYPIIKLHLNYSNKETSFNFDFEGGSCT